MKQKTTKLLCLLLSAVMLLSLAACKKGGGKSSGDSNLIKLDDYDLLYKSACIMTDYTGVDALVMTLDFTNNGKENASYLWTVFETATQNGTELENWRKPLSIPILRPWMRWVTASGMKWSRGRRLRFALPLRWQTLRMRLR